MVRGGTYHQLDGVGSLSKYRPLAKLNLCELALSQPRANYLPCYSLDNIQAVTQYWGDSAERKPPIADLR